MICLFYAHFTQLCFFGNIYKILHDYFIPDIPQIIWKIGEEIDNFIH
jgi:hypothetical protein